MGEINIKGDKNIVIQDSKDSNISTNDSNFNKGSKKNTIGWIGLVIAIASLLVAVIIGWDNILKFFGYV